MDDEQCLDFVREHGESLKEAVDSLSRDYNRLQKDISHNNEQIQKLQTLTSGLVIILMIFVGLFGFILYGR